MQEVLASAARAVGPGDEQGPPTYVVGIGASAGGLEALEGLVEQLPPDSGMAFVVVQHLSPDFKSLMGEILSRRTTLPVKLVEDGVLVEPNQIYLIPSKKEMIISQGRLLLSDRNDHQDLSLPIDVFFRSLAHDCGQRAVAIVLSGSGSDGSRGICDVHDAGGLILVQDLESAQFDGMPKAARDAGVADYVLAPSEMSRVLLEHASHAPAPLSGLSGAPLGMTAIYRMLEKEFGIDFTDYKPSTITRRIERRLQLSRAQNIDDYVQRLVQEHDELDTLYRDLLIGVTQFFRNPEAFSALQERILPALWAALEPGAPFRVWVAGCATGEEVYSLAILLHELGASLGERPVKIFATDVHHGSLELATRALYDEHAMANVSAERLERYFLRRGESYQVSPEIRQMVVFAAHNVTKDAPFTRVDLITCRNLLIYLQPAAQQRVLSLFHFALKRGGVMFMGPSESPGAQLQDFQTLDKHWRLFKKHSDSRMQVDLRSQHGSKHQARSSAAISRAASAARHSSAQLLSTYDSLLDQFIPPSLLINDDNELVHAFGGASKFLRLQDGRQPFDVLELVDGDLRTLLPGGLNRCRNADEPLVFRGVRLPTGDGAQLNNVTLRPIKARGTGPQHVLISFEPVSEGQAPSSPPPAEVQLELSQISHERMGSLEEELRYTKENLQAVTEALETSNEELQATNEELLASNEELQSTNEELQSVNEELYSVNAEYQRKIGDLTELANDMENLLASTDIGTVFLDSQLKIRSFTARAAESFNFLPQDIGRPIENLSHSMDYPELAHDLKRVLASGSPVEKELRDRHGRPLFARVLPYRAKGAVDGVVLTLVDVSGLKAAEDALFHERYLLNSLLSNAMDAIYFKDGRGRFIRANHAMAARLGLSDPRDAVGKTGFELPGHQQALAVHQQDDVVLRSGVAEHDKLEQRKDSTGADAWDLVTRLPLFDASSQVVGIIGIFRDVTEQKRAEAKIQEAVSRRDQFLAMLSHELRNPLGAVASATALLGQNGVDADRKHQLIDVVSRQSHQMSRLLDDLLEVSRVTQDKIELRSRLLDLKPVVEEAVAAVAGLLDSRQIELHLELDSGPLHVEGDPARLQQIQVNLLTNAAKYTPRGGHIWLQAKRDGSQIVLRVRDDGMGIPKHMLDDVFELFVQSHRTLERAEGGLGVGLTLVRGLVTKHGGQVSAHSDGEGKGSEFVVRLPAAAGSPRSAPPAPPSNPQAVAGLRVAIVEDGEDSRVMLCELLELAGFLCKTAATGPSALELIDDFDPDVALIDIGLPEIDGLEVARRIRGNSKHARMHLIALTGYGQREDRENTQRAGFDDHIVKPVNCDSLIRSLARHGVKARELADAP